MEILFECRYKRTRKLVKELYGYLAFKRPINIVFFVIFGICILLNAYLWFEFGNFNAPIWFCLAFLVLYKFLYYFCSVNALVKRDLELNDGEPPELHISFTDDKIGLDGPDGSHIEITFDKIKKVVKTKNNILMYSKANLLWILPKNSFVTGNAVDFLEFMKSKGIKV